MRLPDIPDEKLVTCTVCRTSFFAPNDKKAYPYCDDECEKRAWRPTGGPTIRFFVTVEVRSPAGEAVVVTELSLAVADDDERRARYEALKYIKKVRSKPGDTVEVVNSRKL